MDPTFTLPDGFEVHKIPLDDHVKHPVYRVTFASASTTQISPTAPILNDYVLVGMICVSPWALGFSAMVFAPKADARYPWEIDDIDLGSFYTMDQALKTIVALTPLLWVPWLNNTDHVW